MAIPETQLQTWTNLGATTTAERTHEEVRRALLAPTSPLIQKGFVLGQDFEIYLQGSYRNTTNIRGDSDVDVVVQLLRNFTYSLLKLAESEKAAFKSRYSDATYGWLDFRADVLLALQRHYGTKNVREGNKCIDCNKEHLLEADVVPCITYRNYQSISSYTGERYVEGMTFWTKREYRQVINYPKEHISNGARKNEEARGEYKPSIRMFKNARNYLIDKKLFADGEAPSYFIEGLLYNVPANLYGASRSLTYIRIVAWLFKADLDSFICQNGQLPLFGTTPEQWNKDSAHKMMTAWFELWDKWGTF